MQYPSRGGHLPGRAQKSFEGHIDEVPGVCLLRPVSGGCWGLRIPGARNGMTHTTRFPWRLEACATTVEAASAAPIAYESGMNLQGGAQNRVLRAA